MKLALTRVGTPSTEFPPILVLHGLLGQARNWGSFLHAFSRELNGAQVVAPDLRNHGRSPHSPNHTVAAMARDVQSLIEREFPQDDNVILLGHSMGGKVAMHLALTSRTLVSKLIVVDVAPVAYASGGGDHLMLIEAMQRLPLNLVETVPHASELMAHSVPNKSIRDFLLTNLKFNNSRAEWMVPLGILKDALAEVRGTHKYELTGEMFEEPTLFVSGAKSDYVKSEHLPRILELFLNSQLAVIPNAGHWVHAEQPELFLKQCVDFITENKQ